MPNNVQYFVNVGQVTTNMRKLKTRCAEAVHQIADRNFIEMENFAKSNASWTDRTGDARRSIEKVDKSNAQAIEFWLIIGVTYGIWLEIANQGKFQILRPTLTIFEPKIKKELKALK